MSDSRHYLRNVLAQGLSRLLALLASFATFVILARVFGTQQFGAFAFIMACIALAGTFCDLGTTSALARMLPLEDQDGDSRAAFLGDFLVLRAVMAILVAVVAYPIFTLIKPELAPALAVACLAIPLASARFFEPIFQVFDAARYCVYPALTQALVQPAMAVILVLWLEVGLDGYLWGYLATQGAYVAVASALVLILVSPRPGMQRSRIKAIALAAAPLGVSAMFNTINTRADTIMLGYFRSAQEVGLYGAANRLLDLAIALGTSASLPLVPILTRRLASDPENTRTACRRLLELLALGAVPIALVSPHVSPALLRILYGSQYVDAAAVLDLFAWMFVLVGLALLALSINLAAGKVSYTYWNTALGATINLALNVILIPRHGIMGAAWASLASASVMVLVAQYHLWRNLGVLFEPLRWLKILVLLLCLEAALTGLPAPGPGSLLTMAVVYVLAAWSLGLLPLAAFTGAHRGGESR